MKGVSQEGRKEKSSVRNHGKRISVFRFFFLREEEFNDSIQCLAIDVVFGIHDTACNIICNIKLKRYWKLIPKLDISNDDQNSLNSI